MSFLPSIFVGRHAELSTLRWLVGRAGAGERQLSLIVGEPGVGKTSLSQQLAREAAAQGFAVASARCWQWGGAPALWPWVQVFRELCRLERGSGASDTVCDIAGVLGRLESKATASEGRGDEPRFALFDRVMDALALCARGRPLLVQIDDLHAADVASIDLLRFYARDTRTAQVIVVATVRDIDADASEEARALVDDLYREATVVKLTGLGSDELRAFLTAMGSDLPTSDLLDVVKRATGGNPLFVDGLVRSALADGGLDRVRTGEYQIPPGVRGTIERRLKNFSDAERSLLGVVAGVGRECTAEFAAQVAGVDLAVAGATFSHALQERVLVESVPGSTQYAFSHALIAEVLYREIDAIRRPVLHRALAEALERSEAGNPSRMAAELARHYLAAGPGKPRQRGIEFALQAGAEAMQVFAYEESANLYARALAAMDSTTSPEARGHALLEQARALLRSGRPEASRVALRRLIGEGPTDDLFAEAALLMAATGEFAVALPEGVQLLEQAERRVRDRDGALRVRVLSQLATVLWTDQRARNLRERLTDEAVRLAETLADFTALSIALAARVSALAGPDHLEERLTLVERLLSAAVASEDDALVLDAHRWRLNACWEAGDMAGAAVALDEYERLAARLNWPQARMNAALRRAVAAELASDLERVEAEGARIAHFGRLARDPQTDNYCAMSRQAVYVERGDPRRLVDNLPAVRASCRRWWSLAAPRAALVDALRRAGSRDEARALYEECAGDDFAAIPIGFGTVAAYSMLAEACVDFEDDGRAQILRDLLLPHADQNATAGLGVCRGAAARYVGALELLLGHVDRAFGQFEKAIRLNRRFGAHGYVAQSMVDYARALTARGRADDIARARGLVAEASSIAARLGLHELERRIEQIEGAGAPPLSGSVVSASLRENELCCLGDTWTLRFQGTCVMLSDSRGLRHIHQLIVNVGREVHALELSMQRGGDADLAKVGGDSGEVIDVEARDAYRSRIADLEDQVEEAERQNDGARAGRTRAELEALVAHLSESLGLGGRLRRAGGAAEKARVAVSRAIKRSIDKIASSHPEAGNHFRRYLRTGGYCCYDPPAELCVAWVL